MVLTLEDALGSLGGRVKTQMAGLFDSIGLGRTQEFAFLMYSQMMVKLLVQDHSLRTTFRQKEV